MTQTKTISWSEYRAIVPEKADPDPDDYAAIAMREAIILEYLYLTKRVVSSMRKGMPAHVQRDDLESWAKIGLMKAVQKYNHTLGVPFEAFASRWMRSAIMDGIRDMDWVPRSLRRKQRDIDKAEENLKNFLERTPTEQEVADELGLEAKDVGQTKYKSEISSHTYLEGCAEALNMASDTNNDENSLITALKKSLSVEVRNLPIREATIIALHYYEQKKLAQIAQILGISEVKVGALHQEAVLVLWEKLEATLQKEL